MMNGFGRGSGYDYGNMMGGGWFGTTLVFLLGLLVVVGIVLLVVWAVRSSSRHGAARGSTPPLSGTPGQDDAAAIAKRRLASGEITKEQYDDIVRTLGGSA